MSSRLLVAIVLLISAAAAMAVPAGPAAADDPSAVSVVARGRLGREDMELRINGRVVETWHDISRAGGTYSHTVDRSVVVQSLEVAVADAAGWPESLIVDRVEVDGVVFQSESGSTFSHGSWTPTTGCRPGYKRSQWLQCDQAWFDYEEARGISLTGPATDDRPRTDQPEPEAPEPAEPVSGEPPSEDSPADEETDRGAGAEPSILEVRARGRIGTESMELRLNGRTLVRWDDVASGFRTYRFELTETETVDSLQVAMAGGGWPRALIVDRIEVDGTIYQSEAPATASTGSWTATTGCGPGLKGSEWLHCNDGHFEYRQARGRVLAPGGAGQADRILVMTKSSVFTHPSIADGRDLLNRLAAEEGVELTFTEDPTGFQDPAVHDDFDAVLFLNTDSVVFDTAEEKAAFRRFIEQGKGYIGIHGAAATHWNTDKWDWYRDLVGQRFVNHPRTPNQQATVRAIDRSHPSTAHLPEAWSVRDEWYNFEAVPTGVDVLLAVDETTYSGGTMGSWHPIAWTQVFGPGRSRVWYTNLGHEPALYRDPDYIEHVRGGIRWVLRR